MSMVFLPLSTSVALRHDGGMSDLKKRIRSRLAQRGQSARAVSIAAGLGPEAISNVLRDRSRYPRGDTLRDLATALECSIDWLITGQGAPGPKAQMPRELSLRVDAEPDTPAQAPRTEIPEIDVRAGMGGGGEAAIAYVPDGTGELMETDAVRGCWSLPGDYLRAELRVDPRTTCIIEVQGDSMEPTLRPGDRVMIDTADKCPSPPGVFALWDGFGVVVKRIELLPNSLSLRTEHDSSLRAEHDDPPVIRIQSDNPNHQPYERTAEEINIIGRIVWFGRRL